MYEPSAYFPEQPFSSSRAFVAWLDVASNGYPNADRLPLRLLLLQQKNLKAAEEKRLAKRGR